jgi:hypothetical protein
MMLNINKITDSPKGTLFLCEAPPEVEGKECWSKDCETEFYAYLERSKNRSVLTGERRETHRYWINNPKGKLRGDTPQQRAKDANDRTHSLASFELQKNQVYRKAEKIKGHQFPSRYAACVWDSFDIICTVHRALKHFGE